MPERLFVFMQMEFPWVLGPQDGRYLLRRREDSAPEHVVVLGTLGAGRAANAHDRPGGPGRWPLTGRRESRRAGRPATPEPAPVTTTRVTVIDPISLSAEHQARAWLADLDRDRDVRAAAAVINRVLHLHRIAAADPYVHEVSPAQALVIRAGWGEGEQVADGRWVHARELPWSARSRRSPDRSEIGQRRRGIGDRSAALRPLERLAVLLGGRGASLLCEELVLRARLDLDHGRLAHAALELDRAYAAALPELRGEGRQDLAFRIAELEQLRAAVAGQALAALPDGTAQPDRELDDDVVAHALERLEAALRARTATGFS
ncbi:MAG TPA: hypothetical protein VES97_08260 [Solirubrobacteraceae bacterium]|nr:hypothetical protein [Solirubrobacteraceae bacterium]